MGRQKRRSHTHTIVISRVASFVARGHVSMVTAQPGFGETKEKSKPKCALEGISRVFATPVQYPSVSDLSQFNEAVHNGLLEMLKDDCLIPIKNSRWALKYDYMINHIGQRSPGMHVLVPVDSSVIPFISHQNGAIKTRTAG